MAEAALQVTKENDNYQRLQLLLLKAGTIIVRELFDSIHNPKDLALTLLTRKPKLEPLKKGKVISGREWNILYPSNTTYGKSKDFDLSLLIKLLRNICNLGIPSNEWDRLPNDADLSLEDDLARIKYHRNETLAHTVDMNLSDCNFNKYWQEIREALLRIRNNYSPKDVDDWRRQIDEKREDPIADEDREFLEHEYQGMLII